SVRATSTVLSSGDATGGGGLSDSKSMGSIGSGGSLGIGCGSGFAFFGSLLGGTGFRLLGSLLGGGGLTFFGSLLGTGAGIALRRAWTSMVGASLSPLRGAGLGGAAERPPCTSITGASALGGGG